MMKIRAHHLRNLFFDYIRQGELPANYREGLPLTYPISVTDSTEDAVCVKCRTYPEINLCNGRFRLEDQQCAEILYIEIGHEYTAEMLVKIFDSKAHELGLKKKMFYDGKELLEKFRG